MNKSTESAREVFRDIELARKEMWVLKSARKDCRVCKGSGMRFAYCRKENGIPYSFYENCKCRNAEIEAFHRYQELCDDHNLDWKKYLEN